MTLNAHTHLSLGLTSINAYAVAAGSPREAWHADTQRTCVRSVELRQQSSLPQSSNLRSPAALAVGKRKIYCLGDCYPDNELADLFSAVATTTFDGNSNGSEIALALYNAAI